MEVFGKFKINGSDVYRTEAYIDLDPCFKAGVYQLPYDIQSQEFSKKIIGTIFMANPGGSVPSGFKLTDKNCALINCQNFPYLQYVPLVKDPTMNIILELLCNSCYKSGLIEIKNLFNLREPKPKNINYSTVVTNIANALAQPQQTSPKISWPITFQGDFVFFAFGVSLVPYFNQRVPLYYQQIMQQAMNQNLKISYVTKESTQSAAQASGAFYHPRACQGAWLNQKYAFKNLMRIALCNQIKIQYKHPNTFISL